MTGGQARSTQGTGRQGLRRRVASTAPEGVLGIGPRAAPRCRKRVPKVTGLMGAGEPVSSLSQEKWQREGAPGCRCRGTPGADRRPSAPLRVGLGLFQGLGTSNPLVRSSASYGVYSNRARHSCACLCSEFKETPSSLSGGRPNPTGVDVPLKSIPQEGYWLQMRIRRGWALTKRPSTFLSGCCLTQ